MPTTQQLQQPQPIQSTRPFQTQIERRKPRSFVLASPKKQVQETSKKTILRLPEVSRRIGRGKSSIYAMMQTSNRYYDKNFPKPIRIGQRAVGWLESDIEAWLGQRLEMREVTPKLAPMVYSERGRHDL